MKKMLSAVMALVMILSLTACGGEKKEEAPKTEAPKTEAPAKTETPAETTPDYPEITLQISFGNNAEDAQGKAAMEWKRMVEEAGVNLTVEVFPSNQLGANADVMEQILMGENMVLLSDGSFLCEYGAPELGVLSMAYLFDNWDQCWKVLESDWWTEQQNLMAQNGIHLLCGNWIAGTRVIVCNREVHSLEDLKGLKLRVPNNALSVGYFNALGVAATPMSLSDTYTAIQQGLVDGQENPLEYCYTAGYYEICDYLILSNHVNLPSQFVMSEDVWQSMHPDQQKVFTDAAIEAGWICNELYLEKEAGYVDMFKEAGTTVIELDAATIQSFRDAVAPAFEDPAICAKWQPGLREKILEIANS